MICHISSISKVKMLKIKSERMDKIFTYLQKYVSSTTVVIVAVSGGSDSMFCSCLIYGFYVKNKFDLNNLKFVHCCHNTRKENTNEQAMLEGFFGKQLVVFDYKWKDKSEEAMRNWRYQKFDQLANDIGAEFVVLGHHLDDRVESSFLNLLRGAGLNGFVSMRFCDRHPLLANKRVLRPLIACSKNQIVQNVKKNNIPYLEDPSNYDANISKRNFLRNKILPELFALSHKKTEETNSFLESMAGIYSQLEQREVGFGRLIDIAQSPFWKADWAVEWEIRVEDVSMDSVFWVWKEKQIANNVSQKFVKELTYFLANNKSWSKFINGVTFFVSHGRFYLIKAERNFWKKWVSDEESGGKNYPKPGDRYRWKTWNQWCINEKIPVFWRRFLERDS